MKLQHLGFFTAVVECGGVTKASERLHVSQPALSAGLKGLELVLGEPLFHRHGGRRRVVPTPKALAFHQHAKDILSRCDAARAAFRRTARNARTVRIGVLSTLAPDVVAATLRNLRQGSPGWRIREGTADDLVRWLRQGRIDIAWTVIETRTQNAQVLWREPFVVLAAQKHRLAQARRRKLALRDLDGERLVLRGSCELKTGKLQAAGVHMPIAARVARDDLALRLVAEGVGIAVAPRSLATREAVPISISDLGLSRTIGLRWGSGLPEATLNAVRNAVPASLQPRS